MPLTSEQVYNDLNGQDCKEILLTRCADLLNQVKEFQPNLTLPRVQMKIEIHLEVWGRTPPTIDISDDLIVRMRDLEGITQEAVVHELEAEINSDTNDGGQPPDQIREEHGVAVMTPQRGPMGMEDVPVVRQDRIKYAFSVTQDYGPARTRTGNEAPIIGAEVIAAKNSGGGKPEVSPNFDRVSNPKYHDKYDTLDVNGQH